MVVSVIEKTLNFQQGRNKL